MAKRTRMQDFTEDDRKSIYNVARNIVRKDKFSFSDIEDVQQELAIGLYRESHNFRSGLSDWKTFRWKILAQLSGKIIRKQQQKSNRYMTSPNLSLNIEGKCDDYCPDDHPTVMDCVTQDGLLADGTESDGVEEMGLKIDVQNFMHTLTPELQKICYALIDKTPRMAAAELGIGKTSLYEKITLLRSMMIEAGLDAYIVKHQ